MARGIKRRTFLAATASVLAGAGQGRGAAAGKLSAGQATVDITPPLGIEMGGFHRAPGNERRIRGIRGPTAVRALALQSGDSRAIVVSLDAACIDRAMADRVRARAARATGIPASAIHLACTHTHSMPSFCFLRQWGAVPADFMAAVEDRTVEAIGRAVQDLSPADLHVGKSRAAGGNHNRTTKTFKTDEQFGRDSSDAERWLDTTLHALIFQRAGKTPLLWYHFSAHAVCFADEQAGPDWPGTVAQLVRENEKLDPSFLQGHSGDVNPGDGKDWRGEIAQTTAAIYPALKAAIANAAAVPVDAIGLGRRDCGVPYDLPLFRQWLEEYRADPKKCVGGAWVDAGFAADWYKGNVGRNLSEAHLPITLGALRLGPVAMLFHPAELYSAYGLEIRRDSPAPHTLVVGYSDGIIGYLPDPNAYKAGEYAATTVPKILDFPPFTPTAGREMTAAAKELLRTFK